MAVTENNYVGDGTTVEYTYSYPIIDTTDISITLNGSLTQDYTVNELTSNIQFNTAPGNGVAIRIFRDTDDETPKATFFSGSAIRAQDLNLVITQVLYLLQELKNAAGT